MNAFGFVGRGVVVGGWITWELESEQVALGGQTGGAVWSWLETTAFLYRGGQHLWSLYTSMLTSTFISHCDIHTTPPRSTLLRNILHPCLVFPEMPFFHSDDSILRQSRALLYPFDRRFGCDSPNSEPIFGGGFWCGCQSHGLRNRCLAKPLLGDSRISGDVDFRFKRDETELVRSRLHVTLI